MNTGVGSLSLLQGNLLTQELNWGLLPCRRRDSFKDTLPRAKTQPPLSTCLLEICLGPAELCLGEHLWVQWPNWGRLRILVVAIATSYMSWLKAGGTLSFPHLITTLGILVTRMTLSTESGISGLKGWGESCPSVGQKESLGRRGMRGGLEMEMKGTGEVAQALSLKL